MRPLNVTEPDAGWSELTLFPLLSYNASVRRSLVPAPVSVNVMDEIRVKALSASTLARYDPLLTATAALADSVRDVLLAIEATVPMTAPAEFLISVPTESSVVNEVPIPVTVVEAVLALIVPVRETSPSVSINCANFSTVALAGFGSEDAC